MQIDNMDFIGFLKPNWKKTLIFLFIIVFVYVLGIIAISYDVLVFEGIRKCLLLPMYLISVFSLWGLKVPMVSLLGIMTLLILGLYWYIIASIINYLHERLKK